MTDRRPDIHCSKCGKYLYSLSHNLALRKWPKKPICASCLLKAKAKVEAIARAIA